MSAKPRSIVFSIYFMAVFFIFIGMMMVRLDTYLEDYFSGFIMAPFHVLAAWLLILGVLLFFLGLFVAILWLTSTRRRGP